MKAGSIDPRWLAIRDFSFLAGAADARLAPYARNFWEVRGDFNHARDRMLPCHQAAIVVCLGAPQSVRSGKDPRVLSGAWVCGPQLLPSVSISPPGTWICGVRLTHRGAFQALGVSPHSLAGRMIDLADIWGARAHVLWERMRSALTAAERFDLLGQELLKASNGRPEWSAPVEHAVRSLRLARGRRTIRSLAVEIGWSRQWLHRSFQEFLGVSPKAMARLERFSHAVDLVGFAPDVDLSGVAQGAGYFDQAHFTRDFTEFSGLTPSRFLRNRVPDLATGFQ